MPVGSGADHSWRCNLEPGYADIRRSYIDHCTDSDRGLSGRAEIHAAVDQWEDGTVKERQVEKTFSLKNTQGR